mmetsp:Transcript_37697/g.94695  ORF Transcript_37697/g.94695 Transcript_37697/m.94695 type:complete len:202 (-) Transcript_37697:127-732(-)
MNCRPYTVSGGLDSLMRSSLGGHVCFKLGGRQTQGSILVGERHRREASGGVVKHQRAVAEEVAGEEPRRVRSKLQVRRVAVRVDQGAHRLEAHPLQLHPRHPQRHHVIHAPQPRLLPARATDDALRLQAQQALEDTQLLRRAVPQDTAGAANAEAQLEERRVAAGQQPRCTLFARLCSCQPRGRVLRHLLHAQPRLHQRHL